MEDLRPYLFWVVALLTGFSAVAVVASQNIVRSATWLLFTLAGVSAIFFLLGADFVGAIQLLVYVGGTMVLVVFGVMLTAQGPFINMKSSAGEWGISTVVGLLLFAVLAVSSLPNAPPPTPKKADTKAGGEEQAMNGDEHKPGEAKKSGEHHTGPRPKHTFTLPETVKAHAPKETLSADPKTSQYSDTLGLGFLGIGVGPAHKEKVRDDSAKGYKHVVVRTHYFLPFLIVSVHLLVVLIGAAYLARAKRHRRATA